MVLEIKTLDLNVIIKYFKENLKFTHQRCSTHPHQIHFELLSEQGLVGYFIFYFIFIQLF